MTEEKTTKLVNDCFHNRIEPKILHLWCELDWNKISKNRQHQIVGNRLVNTNTPFMKKLIEEITIESKLQNIKWQKVKTWLMVYITKKTKKGDPANVIDVLLDCVKVGIGVDDVEYSLIIDSKIDISSKPNIHFWILQGSKKQIEESIITFLRSSNG